MSTSADFSACGGVLIAFYHYIRDAARINALPPAVFEAQLDWISRRRRIVGYAEFEAALTARRVLDDAALLTFDDGFIEHHEYVFPVLKERGASGVFFLAGLPFDNPPRVLNVHKTHLLKAALGTAVFSAALRARLSKEPVAAGARDRTEAVYRYDASRDSEIKHLLNYELAFDVVDEVLTELFAEHIGDESDAARALYLSADAVREMARQGMVFGFHTEHHRVLARLSETEQEDELRQGVEHIRALTGQASVPFCYPYGHRHTYNATTMRLLDTYGYAAAFNTTRRVANTMTDDRFEVPRFDTRDLPPMTEGVRA